MEIKVFAFLPVTVTSGKRIWFKYYFKHKTLYDPTTNRPPLNCLYFEWSETEREREWRIMKENIIQNRNVWNDPILTSKEK